MHVKFNCFPRTLPPPAFCRDVVSVFEKHSADTCTITLDKGLTSDQLLARLSADLLALGFQVELGKTANSKIKRPVFFGENGEPELQYEIDAFHPEWKCGLELEAGRALQGNAFYRDLVQGMVMVGLETLMIAVPNSYKYVSGDRPVASRDFEKATAVADALYGHSRIAMPYSLVLIGY